jgi:hypothetical protein
LLDGAEACGGGLDFASEMLFSTITVVVTMYPAIQHSINGQKNFDEGGE